MSSSLQHATGITVCTCPLAHLYSAAGVLLIESWRRGTFVICGMACTRCSLAELRNTIEDHIAPGATRIRLGAQSLVQLPTVDCTVIQTVSVDSLSRGLARTSSMPTRSLETL